MSHYTLSLGEMPPPPTDMRTTSRSVMESIVGPFGFNLIIGGAIIAAALGGYAAWRLSGRRVWPAVAGAIGVPVLIYTVGKARQASRDRRQAEYIAKYGDPWKQPRTATPKVQSVAR